MEIVHKLLSIQVFDLIKHKFCVRNYEVTFYIHFIPNIDVI